MGHITIRGQSHITLCYWGWWAVRKILQTIHDGYDTLQYCIYMRHFVFLILCTIAIICWNICKWRPTLIVTRVVGICEKWWHPLIMLQYDGGLGNTRCVWYLIFVIFLCISTYTYKCICWICDKYEVIPLRYGHMGALESQPIKSLRKLGGV